MAEIFHKVGCQFAVIAPGGFRILWALGNLVRLPGAMDIIITSGTDGEHSGPDDPHHQGMAYDLRSHDFPTDTQKDVFLRQLMASLDDGDVTPQDGGYVSQHFFAWLEQAGTPNEHFHVQQRHGVTYS